MASVTDPTPRGNQRRSHRPALVLALLAASAAAAEPADYVIDPEHLSIGFLVDHVGYNKVLGMFRKGEGSFRFDEETGRLSELRIRVDSASVFTNDEKRDEHLRSKDFLDVEAHPQMVYFAAEATPISGRDYAIEGELELLGEKRPVKLRATWNKSAPYPFGGHYVTGISARGVLKRSEFGMSYAVANGWVGDEVELIIEFEARRQ